MAITTMLQGARLNVHYGTDMQTCSPIRFQLTTECMAELYVVDSRVENE
jgi:hypothetical protein